MVWQECSQTKQRTDCIIKEIVRYFYEGLLLGVNWHTRDLT